ncbi:MAG: DNA adenine methylase [Saprospiraceae bacterium]|nr:DNA adenine methylase [Saprospiraceae bacterium]
MIKSPLRYPGGKSRAVTKINSYLPEFREYREPFVGGGSLFIYLKQFYPQRTYWINDIYQNLYHFWNECQSDIDGVIGQVWKWRREFDEGKKLHRYLIDNIKGFDNLKKAAAFFVFNRITFSGTTESGGFSNAAFEKRFTESSIDRVRKMSTLLSGVRITNFDYREVVNPPGDKVLLFLDPPYYSAEKSALYGKNGCFHKSFDHIRFMETIRDCGHKWLITYDNSAYIKELFSFANIYEWNLTYGMRNVSENSNQNGKELFITNYPLDYVESEQMLCDF